MATKQDDSAAAAVQTVVQVLSNLSDSDRKRVLSAVSAFFGDPDIAPRTPKELFEAPTVREPENTVLPSNIRSLREEKQPRSASEMAALVAYYLSELAPIADRKIDIDQEDVKKYFKQAGYPLPAVPAMTLPHAAAAGYFENPTRGVYRLNPVGHNLVVHQLPKSGGSTSPAKAKRVKKVSKRPRNTKPQKRKSTKKRRR